jgi:hypothetical protein
MNPLSKTGFHFKAKSSMMNDTYKSGFKTPLKGAFTFQSNLISTDIMTEYVKETQYGGSLYKGVTERR